MRTQFYVVLAYAPLQKSGNDAMTVVHNGATDDAPFLSPSLADAVHVPIHWEPKSQQAVWNHQEALLTDIQQLTRKLSDIADGIWSEKERAITRLFSPSPTNSNTSNPAVAIGDTSLDSYSLHKYNTTKEDELVVERKIMCIEKQMDCHKFVISSEFFFLIQMKKGKPRKSWWN
jgi:hypothetical protein